MSRLSIIVSMIVGIVADIVGIVLSGALIRDATHDLAILARHDPTPIRRTFVLRDRRDAAVFLLGLLGSLFIDILFLWGAWTAHLTLEGIGGAFLLMLMVVVPGSVVVNLALKVRERRRLKRMARDLAKEGP